MDILAIFIGLIILAGGAFYISRPLMQPRRGVKAGGSDALSLEAQRDSLYTQIKELDLDHATGKVNDEDYSRLRAELVTQAADVLRQIDNVGRPAAARPAAKPAAALAAAGSDEVEALIAARRKTRSVAAAKSVDADIEAAISARRKAVIPTVETAALTCPNCGKPVSAGDAFCAKCGTALQVAR